MEKINEDEFYEYWRKYRDDISSLPVEVRSNFEWLMVYEAVMIHRKRICDTLEKIRRFNTTRYKEE